MHESKYIKVKDRSFAEGSIGCHVLLWLDAQKCKRMSLYIATFDRDLYYAVRRFYFFHITSSYQAYFLHTNGSYIFREQFLLLVAMTTYLKDLTQSIGSYGGLLKIRLGFKGFWMHK